jgi:hypothetical protein
MRKLTTGLVAIAVLMGVGLVSNQAEAAPRIPEIKQQSLVDEAGWRPRRVFRPVRRTARAVTRPVRRLVRPVGRIVRPWRW